MNAASHGLQSFETIFEQAFTVALGEVPTDRMPAEPVDPPLRRSKSTGLAGVFQCNVAWHHQWKSRPSWPTLVVASTNGQNGLLNALRMDGWRSLSSLSARLLPYRRANREPLNRIGLSGWSGSNAV